MNNHINEKWNCFMKYIVYLTKNKIDGRIFIGVHGTEDVEIFDGYIGNGVWANQPSSLMYPKTPFQYACKKYGIESFDRTTLYVYGNEKKLNFLNYLIFW